MHSIFHKVLKVPYIMHIDLDKNLDKRNTLVFIHGLGNNSTAWDKVIDGIPKDADANIVTVDLIGFGKSEKPNWIKYDVNYQARSLKRTLDKSNIKSPIILVGHSLGSLVSIEFTKQYPDRVKSLILCSPPLYKESSINKKIYKQKADDVLKNIYTKASTKPAEFLKVTSFFKKHGIFGPNFMVDEDNIGSYMATLSASIVKQTSLKDAMNIDKPITILYGLIDPFVVTKNLRDLKKANKQVTLKIVASAHEVKGLFATQATKTILSVINKS